MNFYEAMERHRQGEKVRKFSWAKSEYISRAHDTKRSVESIDIGGGATWEIYGEPEAKSLLDKIKDLVKEYSS